MPGGAGVQPIMIERTWPAGTVNPVSGAAWTAGSQPGSTVIRPIATSSTVSLWSAIAPDPEPPAGSSTIATSGSAWKLGVAGAATAQPAAATAVSTTRTRRVVRAVIAV